MNVKLLRKIKRHVLAEPERIDMDRFICRSECGTVGCIAGWAVILSTDELVPYRRIESRATMLLGITYHQALHLFYTPYWPQDLAIEAMESTPQTKEHAELVARRIDRFIRTEGLE